MRLSRREALRAAGGAALAGMCLQSGPARADDAADEMTLVDAHVHIINSRLPGGLGKETPLAPFDKDQPEAPLRLARTVEDQMRRAGVTEALCMPRVEVSDDDPLGIRHNLAMAKLVEGVKLHPIGLAHPERFDRDHLKRVEEVLERGDVKALKAYLGYLHYDPYCPAYRPYFKLAGKHNIPVIFHTGDTYSRTAKVKFAHPLKIDEVAVDFPDTKFVLAHFGNPWIMDAAEVLYKNANVFADLSAFLIGDAAAFAAMEQEGVLARVAERVKEAIAFSEAPHKFLFGSDWPLAPVTAYRDFVKRMFPPQHHGAVFGGTARELFRL
ncbi:MAG: amidohydrolase [Planctomycetes bacterium]|nr:amidohydrolase [Planctomycetota bacterium]